MPVKGGTTSNLFSNRNSAPGWKAKLAAPNELRKDLWDRRKPSKSKKAPPHEHGNEGSWEKKKETKKTQRAPRIFEKQDRGGLEKGADCKKTPSSILMRLLDNNGKTLSDDEFTSTARFIHHYPRLRLPVVLSKLLLARDERFHKYKTREEILAEAEAGWFCRTDVEQWEWIIQGRNSDVIAERFVSSDSVHPISLLSLVLRPNAVFTKRSSLEGLLRYMAKWHATGDGSFKNGVQPAAFLIPMRRFALHCCRVWPDLIPALARVAAAHIQDSIPNALPKNKVYNEQRKAFNEYLQMFASAPDRSGRRYMEFIWEAQRVLLAMSNGLERPLMLEKKSFDAIRIVLVGLEKTPIERDEATRWGKTWPPFKVIRDGLDEVKDAGDDFTRAVKAGLTMEEAGHAREPVDAVIDTLAGVAPDGSPTIQTRANLAGLVRRKEGKIGAEEVWATRVRTTRNPHEAWTAFQHPPDPSCRRNHQVYGELFAKLTARTPENEGYLPGDGRHVVEVHIPNLSDFERARIQPPTVTQLYDQMLQEGVKPEGHCLVVLLRSASHLRQFQKYLHDSTLDPDITEWFADRSDMDLSKIFDRMPFGVFQAYISLLCQLHPRAVTVQPPSEFNDQITEAIQLVTQFSSLARTESRQPINTRPLWNLLLDRLSKPRGVYVAEHVPYKREYATLLLYCDVLSAARNMCALDCDMFFFTARAISNAMRPHFSQHLRPENEPEKTGKPEKKEPGEPVILSIAEELRRGQNDPDTDFVRWAQQLKGGAAINLETLIGSMARFLAASFDELSSDVAPLTGPDGTSWPMPSTYQRPRGMEAHIYMQTLAHLLDYRGMLRLLEWIADEWTRVVDEKESGPALEKNRFHLRRAVCAFRALAERFVPEEELASVKSRLVEADGWPGQGEVKYYLEANWPSQEVGVVSGRLGFARVAGREYWSEGA